MRKLTMKVSLIHHSCPLLVGRGRSLGRQGLLDRAGALRGGDHRAEGLPRQALGEGEGRGVGRREGSQREGEEAERKDG